MKYQFKTNINCGGCIAKVAPHLNGNKDVSKWQVDTTSPSKVLSIDTDHLSVTEIIEVVKQAGFTATSLNN